MQPFTKMMALAIGMAGALAVGTANPTWAAPVSTGAAHLQEAVPSDVIDVSHRRWRRAAVAGLALGIIGGGYYYGYPYHHYGPPWLGPPGPHCWRHRRHWHCY